MTEVVGAVQELTSSLLISEIFMQIGLGIGISRGDMYLGNVGSGRRRDYAVVGADVIFAMTCRGDGGWPDSDHWAFLC